MPTKPVTQITAAPIINANCNNWWALVFAIAFRRGQKVSANFVVRCQQAGDKNDVLWVSIFHSDKIQAKEACAKFGRQEIAVSSNILRLKKSTSLLIHNWPGNLGPAKNRQNGGKEVFGRGSCQSQGNLEQSAPKRGVAAYHECGAGGHVCGQHSGNHQSKPTKKSNWRQANPKASSESAKPL